MSENLEVENKRKIFISITLVLVGLIIIILIIIPPLLKNIYKRQLIQPELIEIKRVLKNQSNNDSLLLKNIKILESLILEQELNSNEITNKIKDIKGYFENANNEIIYELVLSLEKKVQEIKTNPKVISEDLIKILFSWPIAVIFIIITLVYFRFDISQLKGIFNNVKSLSILGSSMEFSEKDFAQKEKLRTELNIKEYRRGIKDLFDIQIQKEELEDKLRYLYEDIKKFLKDNSIIKQTEPEFRCTIHIPDALFHDTLYQLLDYYPKQKEISAGRIKSIRFGIIGLAWRTEESQIRCGIDNDTKDLILNWGMDKLETTSNSKIKSFAAILLKPDNRPRLAVVYFDSEINDLFGDLTVENSPKKLKEFAEIFEQRVRDSCEKLQIIESLLNIKNYFSDKALQIRIYEKYY